MIKSPCLIISPPYTFIKLLTSSEGLELANSLIEGTSSQKQLQEFQKVRKQTPTGKLGQKYWTGFLKQHAIQLTTKQGQHFAANRSDWSKRSYVKQMYDCIYDAYVEAGVAKPLDQPVFMDINGQIVSEKQKYGELVDIQSHIWNIYSLPTKLG